MIFTQAAASTGRCSATDEPLLVVAGGRGADKVPGVVETYHAKNPGASPLLASAALLRLCALIPGQHMLRVGILHIEDEGEQALLSSIGDVRLWRRRCRRTERFLPPPGAAPTQDAIGLPGSQVQRTRVPLSPGDRLVVGTRALGSLGPLALYAVLSSPRRPDAAVQALLSQIRTEDAPDGAAVGVLLARA